MLKRLRGNALVRARRKVERFLWRRQRRESTSGPLRSTALRTLFWCLSFCIATGYLFYLEGEPLLLAETPSAGGQVVGDTTSRGVVLESSVSCEDETIACEVWADHDLCLTNRGFMHLYCPRSCGMCSQKTAPNQLDTEKREREREAVTHKASSSSVEKSFYVFDPKKVGPECADKGKCYHGEKWVIDKLLEMRWKRVYSYQEADFIWTFAREFGFSFANLGKTQVVNHVGGVARKLGDKSKLYHTLGQYGAKVGCDTNTFIPQSFDTTKAEECTLLLSLLRKNVIPDDARWLLKPAYGSGGQGIQILPENKDMMDFLIGNTERTETNADMKTCRKDQVDAGVAQRYISNPLLLKFLNFRKFNVRAYVLIASTDPLRVYVSENYAYVSASAIQYNFTDDHFTSEASRAMALTGLHAQEPLGNDYDPSKRMYSLHEVATAVEAEFPDKFGGAEEPFLKHVTKAIEVLVRFTILSVSEEGALFKSPHHFSILAFDMLLDEDFHLWLLEVNCYPWMSFESENHPHKNWMQEMVEGTIEQVLQLEKSMKTVWNKEELKEIRPKQSWHLILDMSREGEATEPSCPNMGRS